MDIERELHVREDLHGKRVDFFYYGSLESFIIVKDRWDPRFLFTLSEKGNVEGVEVAWPHDLTQLMTDSDWSLKILTSEHAHT